MLLSRNTKNPGLSNAEYYGMLAAAGWQAVDLNETCFPERLEQNENYIRDIAKAARDAGLVIGQCHAPMAFGLQDHTPEDVEKCICQIERCIAEADFLDIPLTIVHPFFYNWNTEDPSPEYTAEVNVNYLRRICKAAKKTTICLENMPACGFVTNGAEMKKMLEMVGCDDLMVCLDTGHLFFCGGKVSDFFAEVGDRVKALHLHDTGAGMDLHLLPYTGRGDWADFKETILQSGYSGTLNSESDFSCRMPADRRLKWECIECETIMSLLD